MPRKQRLRDKNPDRHAELVRVATRVFATEGYNATNVNRVAELAGVGVGTLYNYFDDKDDLFLDCVEVAAATDLRIKQQRIDRLAPALQMLHDIVRVERELMELDPDGQQLLKSVFYGGNSQLEVGQAAQELYAGSIELVEQALAKGVEGGVFDLQGQTRLAALLITGMVETFHVLGDRLDSSDSDKDGPHPADLAVELLCRGILSEAGRQQGKVGGQ